MGIRTRKRPTRRTTGRESLMRKARMTAATTERLGMEFVAAVSTTRCRRALGLTRVCDEEFGDARVFTSTQRLHEVRVGARGCCLRSHTAEFAPYVSCMRTAQARSEELYVRPSRGARMCLICGADCAR